MGIERIAVGTDFSEASRVAAKQALALARHVGASLELIHAGPVVEVGEPPGLRRWGESAFAARRDAIARLREELGGQGVEISTAVHDGPAAEALCAAAGDVRADLVVVGSHGGGTALARFLLGSVAEEVVRISQLPVLVIRTGREPPAPLVRGGFTRILVGVELSAGSDRVVEHTLELAADGAEVELFHAWSLPSVSAPTTRETELVAELRESRAAHVTADLEQLVLRWRHAIPRSQLYYEQVESLSARDAILERTEARGCDLVAVGSHGRRGLRRWLAGSVAEGVVRAAPCAVLVVKPTA